MVRSREPVIILLESNSRQYTLSVCPAILVTLASPETQRLSSSYRDLYKERQSGASGANRDMADDALERFEAAEDLYLDFVVGTVFARLKSTFQPSCLWKTSRQTALSSANVRHVLDTLMHEITDGRSNNRRTDIDNSGGNRATISIGDMLSDRHLDVGHCVRTGSCDKSDIRIYAACLVVHQLTLLPIQRESVVCI